LGVGCGRVPGAKFLQRRIVSEWRILGQRVSPVNQGGIKFEGVTNRLAFNFARLFVGFGFSQGNVSSFPSRRKFAGIDLMGQIAIDNVVCPDR